ncbi:restriction endonuclease subunit S [Helicobacter pylori]|uniref:restriction endonuclease subunit S n=1 Tax=Helicobacter pylori TaxID=210 RepID=UPI00026A012C|nr:restriction endonuclease subunit S [Helicobacter pylori]EJB45754.1 type I R-M system specificity subunit [Helicobacter pylori Hp A-17]
MDAFTTPSNWQRVRLGDMTTSFTKQTGFDYSASIKPTLIKEQLPNYIPFIQNKDFLGHYINYKTDYFIPNEIAIRFPQILLNEKCLLISISGAIGNAAVFNHSQDAFIGGAIAVLKFKEKKSLDFVMHFLMSASGQKLLLNSVKSSSHKNLTIADLRDLLIPLPPLNEQIAIANVLSDVDRYLYSLDALILKKESVKKALRIKMLNQILASNGIEFRELGDIILSLKTGLNPRSFFKLNTPNANNYYVTIRELEDYTIKFTHQTDRIDDNALSLCLKRSNLEKDDILFSGTGTIGKVSIIEKNPNNWAIKEGIYSIKPNKKIVFPRFLMFCLESSNIQNDIKNKSFGGIVKSIPMNDLQQIQIPLPPLNEQIAIANILSTLDHEIISLKNKKRQFENIKKALNHDLMSAKIRVLKK